MGKKLQPIDRCAACGPGPGSSFSRREFIRRAAILSASGIVLLSPHAWAADVVTAGGWEQSQPPNICEFKMTQELLLLYCLRYLANFVRPGQCQYDYLNIARILRQLLLDRPSVVDGVNRYHKVPLEFRVSLLRRTANDLNQRSQRLESYHADWH